MTPEQIVAAWIESDLGPTVLVERIRAYGDERAADERARCALLCRVGADKIRGARSVTNMGAEINRLAVKILDNLADAIERLDPSP